MAPITLEQLLNPTQDLGGTRDGDVRAIAQLILGGGSASVGGTRLFGNEPPDPVEEAANRAAAGGFGRQPDPALAQAIREGRVDSAKVNEGALDQRPAGTFTAGRHPVLDPTFQDILDTADQMASSVQGRPDRVTKALLPNPFGPGSFDPNDPEAVKGIQAQQAESQKLDRARNILDPAFLSRLPKGAPVGELVRSVLEDLGLVKSETQQTRENAQAKVEGEIAGGKGGGGLPASLVQAIGTPEFDKVFADAAKAGISGDDLLKVSKQQEAVLKSRKVSRLMGQQLGANRAAIGMVADLKTAYLGTAAATTGKFSDTLTAALSTNNAAASLKEFTHIGGKGLSPEEQEFATRYNIIVQRLRGFSNDNRFSDADAVRTLRGIGNPIVGPGLFIKQLNSQLDNLADRSRVALDAAEDRGQDVRNFRARQEADLSANRLKQTTSPQVLSTLSSGKRMVSINGKLQIEE